MVLLARNVWFGVGELSSPCALLHQSDTLKEMAIPLSEIEPLLRHPYPTSTDHPLQEGMDWQSDPLRPDVEELSWPQRTHAAARWAAAGLSLHAGAARASRFAVSLLSIAAPARLVEAALTVAGDRVRHARLGFGLASAYADRPIGPRCQTLLPPLASNDAIIDEAISAFCLDASIGAVCAAEARAEAEDPAVWDILGTLADDGWRHTRLGWDVVAWAIHTGPPDTERLLRARIDAHIHAHSSRPFFYPESPADTLLIEHGCPSPATRERLEHAVVVQVIAPCIDQFLAQAAH